MAPPLQRLPRGHGFDRCLQPHPQFGNPAVLEKYTSKLDDARKKAIEKGLQEATGAPPAASAPVGRPAGGFPGPSSAAAAASSSPARAATVRMSASSLVAQASKSAKPGASAVRSSLSAKPSSGAQPTAKGKVAGGGVKGGEAHEGSCASIVWVLRGFSG